MSKSQKNKKEDINPEEYSPSYREAERQRLNVHYEQFIQTGGQPKQIPFGVTTEVFENRYYKTKR